MHSFLTRTFLRGVWLVVPLCVIVIVVIHAMEASRSYVAALVAALPFAGRFPGDWAIAWAVVLLVLVCFAAGLVLNLPPLRAFIAATQDSLVERYPLYAYLCGFESGFLGEGRGKPVQAVLAEFDGDMQVLGFVTEELPDGRYVVFVPSTPSARDGSVYIFGRERVHLIDANARQVLHCVHLWGVGAGELVKSMRKTV
jgi:uncharacterized membrane protein